MKYWINILGNNQLEESTSSVVQLQVLFASTAFVSLCFAIIATCLIPYATSPNPILYPNLLSTAVDTRGKEKGGGMASIT